MKSIVRSRQCFSLVLGFVIANFPTMVLAGLSNSSGSGPASPQKNQNPNIAPIHSNPHGKTYGEWATSWWQWALQTPASTNPMIDQGDCSVGQSGQVWFLGGSLNLPGHTGPVSRTCTVPPGTALFFPLFNNAYFAFLNDLPETRTEDYMRDQAKCEVSMLAATIDEVSVKNPTQYLEKSPLFDVQLPEDNVFQVDAATVPKLLLSPGVDQGYYLFLHPLSSGRHTLKWQAQATCGGDVKPKQDVVYELDVLSN